MQSLIADDISKFFIFKFEKSASNASLKEFCIEILFTYPEALTKLIVSSQLELLLQIS